VSQMVEVAKGRHIVAPAPAGRRER
jgi:hypothetical protein